jgi:hypothetical protein
MNRSHHAIPRAKDGPAPVQTKPAPGSHAAARGAPAPSPTLALVARGTTGSQNPASGVLQWAGAAKRSTAPPPSSRWRPTASAAQTKAAGDTPRTNAGVPEVIQCMFNPEADVRPEAGFRRVAIRHGLVHGTYEEESNSADLHVDAKSDGPGLRVVDMVGAAEEVYDLMMVRQRNNGPLGKFILHPTGAAIVKIVVELLGEALGGLLGKTKARAHKFYRKNLNRSAASSSMSSEKLAPGVLNEHFSYLQSLAGSTSVGIIPRIVASNELYKPTMDDYDQNMLEASQAGRSKFEKYKGVGSYRVSG